MLMSQGIIDLVNKRWRDYGIGPDPGPVGKGLHANL
jgi:hypothetical protein